MTDLSIFISIGTLTSIFLPLNFVVQIMSNKTMGAYLGRPSPDHCQEKKGEQMGVHLIYSY